MNTNCIDSNSWNKFLRVKTPVIVLFVLLFCSLNMYATTYYVDGVNGKDSNTGLIGAPWQSISGVNKADLMPGDVVLFARGQIYRGNLVVKSGTSSKLITYGAWGTGSKPLFLGSINKSESSDWTSVGKNLWVCNNVVTMDGFAVDAGNLIFDNEKSIGWKVSELSLVDTQGKFYSDVEEKTLTMYSDGNPGTVYSNIEIALNKHIINIGNQSFVVIENLELRYGGAHGINGGTTQHISVKDVDMKYIGGSYLSGTVRYGNGVQFWNDAHDNRVERCRFSQIYDAALTNQGILDNCEQYNIYYVNNLIDSSEYSFEIWLKGDGAKMHHVYFDNNTCLDAGMGWGNEQRVDPNGSHLCFWSFQCAVNDLYMRNNIFSRVNGGGIFAMYLKTLDKAGITIDHNNWYVSDQLALNTGWDSERPGPINTNYDWNYYRTNTGQDENSIMDDPLLKGFTIPANSPCVNRGIPSPYVESDFTGKSRPQGSAYDIGAYEVDASDISIKIMPLGDSKTETKFISSPLLVIFQNKPGVRHES